MKMHERWLWPYLCGFAIAISGCGSFIAAPEAPNSQRASATDSTSTERVSVPNEPKSIEIDPELEAQVLAILRKHPDVVIESLQAFQQEQRQQQQAQQQTQQLALLKPTAAEPDIFVGESPTTGAQAREIVLYEFSDFECPFCARVHPTLKTFMAQRGGEVTLVYKHFPLERIHPQGVPAARASWAAQQQGKFWEYHDELFERQQQLSEETYLEIAEELGLDLERFNADRESAEAAVRTDMALGDRLGVRGTPFFVLNGIPLNGAVSLEQFEAALAQAKQDRAP
ncbi:MAG: thioredoxin domain-containing protein [Cyanobacteria bacterium P01_D01_bin.123]